MILRALNLYNFKKNVVLAVFVFLGWVIIFLSYLDFSLTFLVNSAISASEKGNINLNKQ